MKTKKDKFWFWIILFGVLLFALGFVVSELIDNIWGSENEYEKKLDGFNMRNANYTQVKDYAQEREPLGDWVCVNVKGMAYERALEVCSHEVGHEIFAEICEENISKCFEVVKILE